MIWVNISGGLGNQLIQIFFAKRLMSMTAEKVCLCSLDSKNLSLNEGVRVLIDNLNLRFSSLPRSYINRKLRRFFHIRKSSIFFIKGFLEEEFIEKSLTKSKHIIFDGYWQEPENILSLARMDLSCAKESNAFCSRHKCNHCVIHLRMGDYRNFLNRLVFCKPRVIYYTNALAAIGDLKSKTITVCSNGTRQQIRDMTSTMEKTLNLEIGSICIFEGSAESTFKLMMDSEYLIGSNSTFSLMAFFLSVERKRMAIFPRRWFVFFDHPLKLLCRALSNLKLM